MPIVRVSYTTAKNAIGNHPVVDPMPRVPVKGRSPKENTGVGAVLLTQLSGLGMSIQPKGGWG